MQRSEYFAIGTALIGLSCLCASRIVAFNYDSVQSWVHTLNTFNMCFDGLDGGEIPTRDHSR
jgi:hypothetical protein